MNEPQVTVGASAVLIKEAIELVRQLLPDSGEPDPAKAAECKGLLLQKLADIECDRNHLAEELERSVRTIEMMQGTTNAPFETEFQGWIRNATASVAYSLAQLWNLGIAADLRVIKGLKRSPTMAGEEESKTQELTATAVEAANRATLVKRNDRISKAGEAMKLAEAAKTHAEARVLLENARTDQIKTIAEAHAYLLNVIANLNAKGGNLAITRENLAELPGVNVSDAMEGNPSSVEPVTPDPSLDDGLGKLQSHFERIQSLRTLKDSNSGHSRIDFLAKKLADLETVDPEFREKRSLAYAKLSRLHRTFSELESLPENMPTTLSAQNYWYEVGARVVAGTAGWPLWSKLNDDLYRWSVNDATQNSDVLSIESAYARLSAISSARVSSPDDPNLLSQFNDAMEQLRKLQTAEAEAIERYALSQLFLPLGEGEKAISKAKDLLAKYADPALSDSATE